MRTNKAHVNPPRTASQMSKENYSYCRIVGADDTGTCPWHPNRTVGRWRLVAYGLELATSIQAQLWTVALGSQGKGQSFGRGMALLENQFGLEWRLRRVLEKW